MNQLKIYYPHKPFIISQKWGTPNGMYAKQFNDPTFKLHNGIDSHVGRIGSIEYQTQFPVYCPVEGFVVDKVQYRPDGGGNEVWLLSKEPIQMFDETCYVYLVLCHAKKILVKPGDEPALGEILMIANNTGFSTGPHTHMGIYRLRKNGGSWSFIDKNDATGSFDPSLFFTKEYAVDVATLGTLVKSGLRLVTYYGVGN